MLSYRQAMLGGVAVCAVVAAATPAAAQVQSFDIPAQPARTAIPEFGRQSGIQILAARADVGDQQVAAIKGEYEPREALRLLLAQTDLRIASDDGRTVTLTQTPQSGSAAGGGAEVEALIVTAQKREEDIQDVPIAISAFTQEQLETHQIAGGPDLMTQIPNMTFTKTNFSSYSIQIRGIGTQAISATTDAAVAVAFNNTPFIRNRFFEQEFYDLQRVEVLRGPQGTLYGRNATAGVVNIITAKPSFGYSAKLSGDIANYNSTRLEGMINIPLAEDIAALRIAGAWTKRDGYAFNEITGAPIDGRDLWSTRVSLRLAPTDRIEANLVWEHFEEDDDRLRSGKQLCHRHAVEEIDGIPVPYGGDGFDYINGQANFSQGCVPASLYGDESFQAPNGYSLPYYHALGALTFYNVAGLDPYLSLTQSRDLRVIESTLTPEYRAKSDLVQLRFDFDVTDNLTLTSETGFNTDRLFSFQDYNRFNTRPGAFANDAIVPGHEAYRENLVVGGVFCDPQLGCADRIVAADVSTAKSTQFSQEFRLGSDFDGPFNFSLGANFLRYDTEDKYYVFINTLTLWLAMRPNVARFPWVPGVSDNTECARPDGFTEPDPNGFLGVNGCTYIDPNPISSLNDQGHNYFLSRNPYKLMSYALFGEAYYNVTDDLKLTAGLRWTVDKKEAPRIPSWVIGSGGEGPGGIGYPVAEVIEQEWREPTGRLTIDWKPDLGFTDETLIYGSYAHGYKAGGANPPAAGAVMYFAEVNSGDLIAAESATNPKTFEPEFVDAFEVGSKNTLLDGSVTLNLATFYYDYKNYQISYITDRSAVNLNFDSQVWGVEVEADWRPMENLRFGFKGGYENTRVADGERAIDVMDRTAGNEDWTLMRPHPTQSSNCIVPTYLLTYSGTSIDIPGGVGAGGLSGCEQLWLLRETATPAPGVSFDPDTAPPEVNNGQGFYKELGGNELPNAPNFTATITADYTIPMANDWLATLHTDLYYQSEAWTRIFNTEGYDKLKAYTNVNLAAIFTNEALGWKIMAYIKNVFDRDSITGAFLNSDDTGLTTNVFLTEPRLYGLRVTKEWTGGPWWTGANLGHKGPYPLTVELGGQVQRHDAPYATVAPSFAGEFYDEVNTFDESQHQDLDWGDGRSLEVTYRPGGGDIKLVAGMRYGRTNGTGPKVRAEEETPLTCAFAGYYATFCAKYPGVRIEDNGFYSSGTNWSSSQSRSREEHMMADFSVGRDVALGSLDSSVSLGLRYARLESLTAMTMQGVPNWVLPDGFVAKYESTRTDYRAELTAQREFSGTGPVVIWDGSIPLLGDDTTGRLELDWSASGGLLYGKQETTIQGSEVASYYAGVGLLAATGRIEPFDVVATAANIRRSRSVNAPVLDLSMGLSYDVGRLKLSTGYRWERYFDVLDVGNDERQDADRTIDGPYFKLAIGFGG